MTSKPKTRVDPATLWIAGGAAVVIAAFSWALAAHRAEPPPSPPPLAQAAPRAALDEAGWDSEPVVFVRGIYDAAASGNQATLNAALDGARIAQRVAREDPARALDFAALDAVGKLAFLQDFVQELAAGAAADAAHAWRPVDGRVVAREALETTVRVTVDRRAPPGSTAAVESRTHEWKLARESESSRWKAWSWERVVTDDERRALEAASRRAVTVITLPSGETLFQAEPHHVDDYADTTPQARERVERLIAAMLDFSLRPKENNLARDELVALGKPAIPALLNQLCDIELVDAVDDPSLAKLNLVDGALRRITGYESSFSALPGQTRERRTLALKAWFAWWERKGRSFTAPEERTSSRGG